MIVIISLLRIIFSFEFLKEGFHSDEVWSYGLANSYYEPFIYDTPDHTENINFEEWITGDIFKEYLTVDDNHRFRYDSVFFNQSKDNHPPLYYILLHTICSFFPENLSIWYGFSINILAYILTVLFLFFLVRNVTENNISGFVCCVWYSFSAGALNTFVYVRMYALLSMFAVISLYLHQRLFYSGNIKKYGILLSLTLLAGSLTHHFFMVYEAAVAVFFCFYYISKKKYKLLISYSAYMIISAGVSIAVFPATISHIFNGKIHEPKYTPAWQIILTFNCLFRELFGFELPVILSFSPAAVLIAALCIVLILSPLAFLLRKNIFIIKTFDYLCNLPRRFPEKIRNINLMIPVMIFSSLCIVLLTALTVSQITMSYSADRYIFFIYPVFCGFVVSIITVLLKKLKNSKLNFLVLAMLCGFMCIASNFKSGSFYLFQRPDDTLSVREVISGKTCVYVTSEAWFLTCLTWEATDAEYIYAIKSDNLEQKLHRIPESPDEKSPLYFIVDISSLKEEMNNVEVFHGSMPLRGISGNGRKLSEKDLNDFFISKYGDFQYIGHAYLFDREHYIYCVR